MRQRITIVLLAAVLVLAGAVPALAATSSSNGITFSVPTTATVKSGASASIKATATSKTKKITTVRVRVWVNGRSATYAVAHLRAGTYQVAAVASWRALKTKAGKKVATGAVHTTVSRKYTLSIRTKATPAPTHTTTPPPAATCYPLTNGGNCYEPGEYCRNSDHGARGVAGNGEAILCTDNNGWRWEPV